MFRYLSPKLKILNCSNNQLNSITNKSDIITTIDISHNPDIKSFHFLKKIMIIMNKNNYKQTYKSMNQDITKLDIFNIPFILNISNFTKITKLICTKNKITRIQNFPPSLTEFVCDYNQLTNLPDSLIWLNCSYNGLICLDNLPSSLQNLYCSNNLINSLDNLSPLLIWLNCSECKINSLDNLPPMLLVLNCIFNKIESIGLPGNLVCINYHANPIKALENIPYSLVEIHD